jgi:electron transfer flavoprotein beta subunit
MNIVVAIRQVPDVVEELEIAADGRGLEPDSLKLRMNEFDEHALEEAILLKETVGGKVTVVALEADGVDDSLFTALAKGADRAVKVTGDFAGGVSSHGAAAILAEILRGMPHDVILTGVQSAEDRDGQVGPLLARVLGLPHVSVVTGMKVDGRVATIHQEYAGGLVGEMEVDLPAVFGIQAAQKPPRYVPVSKVRQAMKTAKIEAIEAPVAPLAAGAGTGGGVRRMFKPESGSRATMIEGGPEEQVDQILAILKERGFLK